MRVVVIRSMSRVRAIVESRRSRNTRMARGILYRYIVRKGMVVRIKSS